MDVTSGEERQSKRKKEEWFEILDNGGGVYSLYVWEMKKKVVGRSPWVKLLEKVPGCLLHTSRKCLGPGINREMKSHQGREPKKKTKKKRHGNSIRNPRLSQK